MPACKKPENFSWTVEGLLAGSAIPWEPGHFQYYVDKNIKTLVTLTEFLPPMHHAPQGEYCSLLVANPVLTFNHWANAVFICWLWKMWLYTLWFVSTMNILCYIILQNRNSATLIKITCTKKVYPLKGKFICIESLGFANMIQLLGMFTVQVRFFSPLCVTSIALKC